MNNSFPSDDCIPPASSGRENRKKEIQCAWSVEELLFAMEDALYETYPERFDRLYLREWEVRK